MMKIADINQNFASSGMKSIRDLKDLKDKKVLLRAPLNVPLGDGGVILDDFRIVCALPTILYLQSAGAKVSIIAHIGRDGTENFEAVENELAKHIDGFGESVILYENLRQDKREVAGDEEFARELASGMDIFVQDAFSVCHREHASVVGVPKFLPSYAGLLLEREASELAKALTPVAPALAILGGAKIKTKEPLVWELLNTYDAVHITGVLANDFWRCMGFEIGLSLSGDGTLPEDLLNHERIVLPDFVTVQNMLGEKEKKQPSEVLSGEKILDARMPKGLAEGKNTILWNGPAGYYEGGFTSYTNDIARAIATSGAYSTVGGGDTVATIATLGMRDKFSHVSTGGGAMLEFLLRGTLPGLKALGYKN